MDKLDKIAPYAKAIIGALVAFLTAIITALEDGSVSAQDWLIAVVALLVSGGAIWRVPNKPPFVPEDNETTT